MNIFYFNSKFNTKFKIWLLEQANRHEIENRTGNDNLCIKTYKLIEME